MGSPVLRFALVLAVLVASACAAPAAVVRGGAPGAPAQEPPDAVLSRFVAALQGGRWAQATSLLSARWRAAYTPSRLAADHAGAGPLAREAVARAEAALRAGTPFQVEDGRAALPVAGGRALLVAEAAGWRVDVLE